MNVSVELDPPDLAGIFGGTLQKRGGEVAPCMHSLCPAADIELGTFPKKLVYSLS